MTMMTRCMGPLAATTSQSEVPNKNGGGGSGGGSGASVQVTRPMLKGYGLSQKVVDKIMKASKDPDKKKPPLPVKLRGGNIDSKLFCKNPRCGVNSMCNMSHAKKAPKLAMADRLGEAALAIENGPG